MIWLHYTLNGHQCPPLYAHVVIMWGMMQILRDLRKGEATSEHQKVELNLLPLYSGDELDQHGL